MNVLRME